MNASARESWRSRAESNRRRRICNPGLGLDDANDRDWSERMQASVGSDDADAGTPPIDGRERSVCTTPVSQAVSHGSHGSQPAFWARIDQSGGPDSCWPWTGHISPKGYGYHGSSRAHRIAFELTKGSIAPLLVIDHLCRNRACCNPRHLRAVTNRENVLAGEHPNAVTWRTGRCRRGHSMRDAKVTKKGRECRKCIRMRDASRRAGKRIGRSA